MIHFTVPGTPLRMTAQQKGVSWRAKKFFVKPEIKDEAHRITMWMKVAYPTPVKPLSGPTVCQILTVHPLTAEQARRHAAELSNPNFLIPHFEKPDADNHAKLILDCISRFGLWQDDKQVCDLHLYKRWGSSPRIEVHAREIGPDDSLGEWARIQTPLGADTLGATA